MLAVAIHRIRPVATAATSVTTDGSSNTSQSSTTFVSSTISGAAEVSGTHPEGWRGNHHVGLLMRVAPNIIAGFPASGRDFRAASAQD